MKAAIIILGNSWVCPYVNTYKRILEKHECAYDVILWDRDGSDAAAPIRYSSGKANLDNVLLKAYHYLRYADFIKRTISENGYDRLIVSGPHLAILLSGFLRKRYKRRYIIDYRDISVEQHLLLGGVYSKVLECSYCNVISSPGFRKYLPAEHDYLISHNFCVDAAMESLKRDSIEASNSFPLEILTIGYIRNYNSNVKIIQSLGGDRDFSLKFVGQGGAATSLHDFVTTKGFANVEFSGFYKKEDEAAFVESCDFINIFFPDDVEHSPIMSNRFYLALIHKKPMIVTKGSVQAAFVKKYGLGVVTGDCGNLGADIKEFYSTYDRIVFCEKCKELLELFVDEYRVLEQSVMDFLQL